MSKTNFERNVAGVTLPRHDDHTSPIDERLPHTWSHCHHENFHLRSGQDYSKNQQKSPSPPSLMSLVGADIVRCDSRIDHIASYLQLHPEWNIETLHPDIPSIFIVNAQIPEDFSTSFFSSVDDGQGWSMVMYFQITSHTSLVIRGLLAGLSEEDLPCDDEDLRRNIPAIKLFMRYCLEAKDGPGDTGLAKNDPMRGRFKVVVSCSNIDQFGFPSFITSYNAKPVLIRNTGTLIRAEQYLEMDINIHKFNNLAKKALEVLITRFEQMLINIAFCIESREDSELPETVLGCASLNRPTPGLAPVWMRDNEAMITPPTPTGPSATGLSSDSST